MAQEALCLSLRNVACERGEQRLFEGVNKTLRAGEWCQIEGHNGIGKTSLLRIIAGLSAPAAGGVYFNDVPIQRQREHYAAHLCYLGHLTGVKPELSAWENLTFYLKSQAQPFDEARLWQALDAVGLIGREQLPCYALSAGQTRRVSLAKLWLTHAPIWILDEPFTAIDKTGVQQLTAHIEQHCQRGGLVFCTSHQPIQSAQVSVLALDEFKVNEICF